MALSTATTGEAALPTARAATSAPDARACPQPNHAIAKNPRMSAVRPLSLRDLACTATPSLRQPYWGAPQMVCRAGPTMSAMTGDGFALSEEQEEFRMVARAFAEEVIGPRAAEIDETDEFPWDIHKAMVAQGFLGIGLPEELGGAGGGPLDVCILIEELARVSGGVSVIPLVNRLAAIPILLAGSEAQKREVVEGLVSGEHQYSYCLTEPGSGSDAAAMASRAVPDGSGWRLTGQKRFITNAGISDRY